MKGVKLFLLCFEVVAFGTPMCMTLILGPYWDVELWRLLVEILVFYCGPVVLFFVLDSKRLRTKAWAKKLSRAICLCAFLLYLVVLLLPGFPFLRGAFYRWLAQNTDLILAWPAEAYPVATILGVAALFPTTLALGLAFKREDSPPAKEVC